jgi:hypothetical protein
MDRLIKRTKLIICDKCPMISKDLIKTVDTLFQDTLRNNLPFGGYLFVFVGNLGQVSKLLNYCI